MNELNWSGLEAAQRDESFGQSTCLTIYLSGSFESHLNMRPGLEALNATNLDGGETGFIYAKVPVVLAREDIELKVDRIRELAEHSGVIVELIDLDPNPRIEQHKFYTLWQSI